MLRKQTIGMKLSLIVFVFSMVLVGAAAYVLQDLRSTMFEERKAKLRALVEAAVNTVDRYGELAATGKMPLEDAQKAALAALGSMNFDGKDYPVTGDAMSDMRSYTKVNDRTLNFTMKKGGKVVSGGQIVVAPDGKTRTVTETGMSAKHKKVKVVAVYDKV